MVRLGPFILGTILLLSAQPKPAPWISLFDGSTPAGWVEATGAPFPTASWTIESGCLKSLPNADGVQDIRTAASFHDFELELEWKTTPAGNSGIKYLIHKTEQWPGRMGKGYQARARGPEYQIADDARNKDALSDPRRRSGGLYGLIAPLADAAKPAGEFNQTRITVQRGRVIHYLNGHKTAEYELSRMETRRFPARQVFDSPISLQNHNSEVWFRNIRIRRLD